MDDIGFLGEIDPDKEGEPIAVSKLHVITDDGYQAILSKRSLVSKAPHLLYLPSLDRKIHRAYVGVSPDDTTYYKYLLQNLTYQEYETAKYEFVDGGWEVESFTDKGNT